MNSFADFALLSTLQASLTELGFTKPTEIQNRAIPVLLQGRSVAGVSETGSGKTLAFALPVLSVIKTLEINGDPVTEPGQPRAVVMVPSRELGEQLTRVFKPFTHTTRVRVRSVLGSMTTQVAKKNISAPFEILVATPGSLMKLLARDIVNLNDVRILVFDEADQMLDKGFLSDAQKIVNACHSLNQMALFSATVSQAVRELIHRFFSGAEIIKSKGSNRLVASLTTVNQTVLDGKRFVVLEKILSKRVSGGTLIFTNTRQQCDTLFEELRHKGYSCAIYRGDMDKVERRSNLKAFRDGKIDLLISTDLGSRGLDVKHVGRVINYHLPQQIENYIHRAGRTARAGRKGTVINLVTERDVSIIEQLKSVGSVNRILDLFSLKVDFLLDNSDACGCVNLSIRLVLNAAR